MFPGICPLLLKAVICHFHHITALNLDYCISEDGELHIPDVLSVKRESFITFISLLIMDILLGALKENNFIHSSQT